MKQISGKWKGAAFLLVLSAVLLFGGSRQVSAASAKCKVTYANARGVVSTDTYKNWAETVQRGDWVVLPKLNAPSGYCYYWVLKDGNTTRKYFPGANFRVTKSVKFCLNEYKLYNVQFMTENGKKEYTSMREKIAKDMYVTLPSVPHNSSSRGLGWATSVNGKSYKKAGTKVKVTKNMKFYPITEKISGVNLRTYNGDLWRVVSTENGRTATFPSVDLGSGNMCLGWSRTRGKSSAPEFLAGDRIPSKSGNYYMVVFGKHMDKAPSYIRQPEKHDKVYMVGDSRTLGIEEVLGSQKPSNVEFIARGSQGLRWFQEEGYNRLRRQVVSAYNADKNTRQAVVINLGVNDMAYGPEYTRYMTAVANSLSRYNCEMYYMSVNPVNSAMIRSFGGGARTEDQVEAFNRNIIYTLCRGSNPSYQYINTCSYLQKYGWISNRHNAGIYDGLHYSNETYLRIYDFCMKILNR